jgi:hypothetical protein
VIEKLSSLSSKENGSIVFSEEAKDNCLWTINMRLFWTSLSMVRLSADCHGLGYFAKVLSIGLEMPGVIHPTGQLLHLISCGSLPILCLVVDLSLNPWEAPGWQVIAVDADVKQVVTSWIQALDNILFTLEHKPWYHCGGDTEMVVVTTLRSDVYSLFHMCHVLISHNILTVFFYVLCIYIAV